MTVDLLIDCTFGLQPLIQRAGFDRTPVKTVQMRERDFMAQAIVFPGLHHLPVLGGIAAKAARIVLAHRDIGCAMHHPAGQFTGQAGPPANADLGAAAAPVVSDTWRRSDQRIAVGRMRDRTMHFALDAKVGKDRHASKCIFQIWHDAIIICFKQFVLGFPRAMIFPDRVGIFLLIDTDQTGLLFHANVAGYQPVIADHRQFPFQFQEFRHRVGNQVMVGHGSHRQLQPRPFTHLPGIGAACIDDMLTNDVALFRGDFPFTGRQLPYAGCAAVADDFCPKPAGTCRHGLGDSGRVDMAIVWGVQRTNDPVEVVERMQFRNPGRTDQFNIEAKRAPHRECLAQPVHLVFGIGQPE